MEVDGLTREALVENGNLWYTKCKPFKLHIKGSDTWWISVSIKVVRDLLIVLNSKLYFLHLHNWCNWYNRFLPLPYTSD